jgi:uncharacterized protein YoxC
MDNKQDRQFYWEVKDFMQKKTNPVTPAPNKLQNTIKEVTSNIPSVSAPVNDMVNSSSQLKNSVNETIQKYQNSLNRQKPQSFKTSANINLNPFRIK